MALENGRTFFAETYVPHLDARAAAALSARLRSAVDHLSAEGLPLVWIRSFALPEDETYVWIVEAADLEQVERIHRRAGVEPDHVAEALPGEASSG